MRSLFRSVSLSIAVVGAGALSLFLTGCGETTTGHSKPPPVTGMGVTFGGKALAGTHPIVGASVQLYGTGTAGNGSAGTALLTSAVTTDGTGAFSVPAGYACPAEGSQLYLVVRGGQIGSSAGNPAITLATVLGLCDQLVASSQFVVNEVTTAATAWGLAQFLSAGGNVGDTATNALGLGNAVQTVENLANVTTGTSPGALFPKTGSSPAARVNSLANLLNTCTAATSVAGCSQLFSAVTPSGGSAPNNTLDAALNIVRNPGKNVAALYTQSTASSAFAPALTVAPGDWTMFVNYTGGGMSSPTALGVDGAGDVWVASYPGTVSVFSPTGTPNFPGGITAGGLFHSYALAVDAGNNVWITNEDSTPTGINNKLGSITTLSEMGQVTSGAGYIAGGIAYPVAIAIDTNQTAWVIDYLNQHLTLLSSTGQPLSGATGYTSTQLQFPISLAIDANHNAWVGNTYGGTVTKVSASGQFTSYACCNWAGGIAIDQRGYAWVANYMGNSVSQLGSDGSVVSSGYTDSQGSLQHPQGIAIDGAGHVWVTNIMGSSITELAGSAASSPGQILSAPSGWAADAGLLEGWAVAVDASGNLWITDFGNDTLTEIVGLATPVKTPQVGPAQSP